MVGIDYWPQEEGYIVEGAPVMMCYAAAAVGENSCVKLSATTAGRVDVAASAAAGDSLGVALRATSGGQYIPVAFGGIVKMIVGGTLALGAPCISFGSDTAKVVDTGTSADIMLGDNGTQRVLGTTLHAGVTLTDEILVLLGRW
jgi:hypothetical protein